MHEKVPVFAMPCLSGCMNKGWNGHLNVETISSTWRFTGTFLIIKPNECFNQSNNMHHFIIISENFSIDLLM